MADAVIVGAGIFGLSCAISMADRGWSITVIDRDFSWGRASSGGDTRLLRLSHGGDDWHRDSARRARSGWRTWSERTSTELFRETGVGWMSDDTDGWVARSRAKLLGEGDRIDDLDHGALRSLLPGIDPSGISLAYLETGAGVLFAERSLQALRSHVASLGVRMVEDRVNIRAGTAVGADTAYGADVTIWACGPWLGSLFPGLINVEVTQQDLVNVAAPVDWHNAPAWLDMSTTWYGTGDVGTGIKVANDAPGPSLDPDHEDRQLGERAVTDVGEFLGRRFPGLAGMGVVATRVCQYTRTLDSEFIVAPHPEHVSTWLVGGGSGHGFKHGPSLGEYVADAVEGNVQPLARHGLGPRSVAGGLRMDAE